MALNWSEQVFPVDSIQEDEDEHEVTQSYA